MDFEFKDRRGEKKAAEAAAPVVTAEERERLEEVVTAGSVEEINKVSGEICGAGPQAVTPIRKKGQPPPWKSVGYLTAMVPIGQATILMMRAVGLRETGLLFTADYAIPGMVKDETENFVTAAKYRLDTFKICACDRSGRCKFHGEVLPGPGGPGRWLEEDIKRLQDMQKEPMPEAVEILMKAEAARANQRIIVPGRPQ